MPDPVDAIVFYVVFVFSVTLHEAGHAWAALRGGDPTAYLGGQVSIDPIPHIRREPFGMVVLPLITVFISGWPFGFASAPYDPLWASRHPKRAAWMALAGPAANLGLALLAALAIRGGLAAGVLEAPPAVRFGEIVAAVSPGVWSGAAFVVSVFFSMNLVLLLLNLIPVPPLDGSGALPLLMSDAATERYRELIHQPMVGIVGILIAWRIFAAIFHPVWLWAVNWIHPLAHYG